MPTAGGASSPTPSAFTSRASLLPAAKVPRLDSLIIRLLTYIKRGAGVLRGFLATIAAALLLILTAFGPAAADTGELYLTPGEPKVWQIGPGSPLHLSYDIEVLSGPPVDILLLSGDDYARYVAGSGYSYIEGVSSLNTTHGVKEADLGESTHYLIADPSDTTGAHIRYSINATARDSPDVLQAILSGGALVLLGMVLIILWDVMARRKKPN